MNHGRIRSMDLARGKIGKFQDIIPPQRHLIMNKVDLITSAMAFHTHATHKKLSTLIQQSL